MRPYLIVQNQWVCFSQSFSFAFSIVFCFLSNVFPCVKKLKCRFKYTPPLWNVLPFFRMQYSKFNSRYFWFLSSSSSAISKTKVGNHHGFLYITSKYKFVLCSMTYGSKPNFNICGTYVWKSAVVKKNTFDKEEKYMKHRVGF